ncbi:MAG: ABC transporter substrate-binding protein [Gammaproteobacteria bacterium]|nr:ABC transporter substrate-binding protein [Gammaproteobacteria bacterium]
MNSPYRLPFVPLFILTGLAVAAIPAFADPAAAGHKTVSGSTAGSNAAAPQAADSSVKDPAALIEKVSNQLIDALNANKAKLKANPEFARQLVQKYLLPHFDFDLTSQLVLGRYWRTATPAQREAFKEGFLHYLTATYSKGLQHYDNVKVEVLPFRGDTSERYVKVRSNIVVPNHSPISVNYALVKDGNGWKVFDFIIEGISYVRTYQTEFRSEIRHTSLEALIKRLQNAKAPASLTAMKAAVPSTAGGA